ncbi:two-component response regulator-like APRR1 [Tanacetum coccineum]|uniref:Two-component response regulator-like APRR1 n=1 Tax=Tanacetum coccineum TaxID=301880 RepID=A0ABQ5AC72_9ASTR
MKPNNPCDLVRECYLLPCGKSQRGKNSKNDSVSGTVTTDDNHIGCCNLRIFLCDTNVEGCHEVFTLLRQLTQAITLAQMKDALVLEGIYIDIILCEVNLLLLDNGELLRSITENTMLQHIPVIMMLSEDQVSLTLNGLGLEAADYLMRPISADELLNLWTHILAKS